MCCGGGGGGERLVRRGGGTREPLSGLKKSSTAALSRRLSDWC